MGPPERRGAAPTGIGSGADLEGRDAMENDRYQKPERVSIEVISRPDGLLDVSVQQPPQDLMPGSGIEVVDVRLLRNVTPLGLVGIIHHVHHFNETGELPVVRGRKVRT